MTPHSFVTWLLLKNREGERDEKQKTRNTCTHTETHSRSHLNARTLLVLALVHTHTQRKPKNAKFIRITCLSLNVYYRRLVTHRHFDFHFFLAISARFSSCLLFASYIWAVCEARTQTININNVVFCMHNKNHIFQWTNTKRSFFISTTKTNMRSSEREEEEDESVLSNAESNSDRDHLTFWFIKWFRNFCCCCCCGWCKAELLSSLHSDRRSIDVAIYFSIASHSPLGIWLTLFIYFFHSFAS